jgi:hypothetical protein
MSWATPTEALSITGKTLTQTQLDVAYNLIEIYVGVVQEALASLKPRDVRLLKKAESYQAAWMEAQVDLLGRSDATLLSQDGLQFSKGDPDMHVLGPLAAASLRRLSWMRTRSLDPLTPTQALLLRDKRTAETLGVITGGGSEGMDADGDDIGGWIPL